MNSPKIKTYFLNLWILGIDEVGITLETFQDVKTASKAEVKQLFSQLNKADVDDLIQKYRVDLEMYKYPVKEFFEYAS